MFLFSLFTLISNLLCVIFLFTSIYNLFSVIYVIFQRIFLPYFPDRDGIPTLGLGRSAALLPAGGRGGGGLHRPFCGGGEGSLRLQPGEWGCGT